MFCLQLTLVCIVLQSNIALIFSAPISDCKTHSHTIDGKEFKVTSHVNVGLADNQVDSSDAQNLLKNHEIQIGDDAAMHIKVDISITPEMLVNSAKSKITSLPALPESTEKGLNPESLQENLPEPVKNLGTDSLSDIKQDQLNDQSTAGKNKDLDASKDLLVEEIAGKTEEKSDVKYPQPKDLLIEPKSEGKQAGEVKSDIKIDSKSISDKTGQIKTEEKLGGEQNVDVIEDGEEDIEDDQDMVDGEDEDTSAGAEEEVSKDGGIQIQGAKDKVEEAKNDAAEDDAAEDDAEEAADDAEEMDFDDDEEDEE